MKVRLFIYIGLILLGSLPFYLFGAFYPISGLPLDLSSSLLMIFVPFALTLIATGQTSGRAGITDLFKRLLDVNRASRWVLAFAFGCVPLVALLSYLTMKLLPLSLPTDIYVPIHELPLLFILYFLGAILEEFGWIFLLTEDLTKQFGPIKSGLILGTVWGM